MTFLSINSLFIAVCVCVCVPALLGMLYAEEKERLDFVYTIYHWWQAVAIFIVYLWSELPMRVRPCGMIDQPSDMSESHFKGKVPGFDVCFVFVPLRPNSPSC